MAREIRPSEGYFVDFRNRRLKSRRRQIRRAWLQIMIGGASLTASQSAFADVPTGGNVVAGAATFSPSANALDINATTSRSIVDWNSFNIGAGNTVNFNLPDSSAAILNRVTMPNMPSAIHGILQSNGNVYLVNPSGIVIGSGGTVDTNAFVASTLDITNQNFLAGGAQEFNDNGSSAAIVNRGTINTGAGGAHLIAHSITNHGSITSTGGNITLSSGGTVTLDNGITYVQPRLDVLADGISPTAGLIRNSGAIRATDAATAGGEVYLVNPSGTILHDGTIAAVKPAPAATAAAPATALTIGGHVQLEASQITLAGDSRIDAHGTLDGGRVLVGGDWQGSGPMHQATRVTMAAGATIDASASDRGDGGTIVLWSDIWNIDSITEVFGALLAKGGEHRGDGGSIETSGHLLQIGDEAHASTRAASGRTGQWLLDPINFTITAGTTPQTTSGIGATTLVNALENNHVTIQTDGATGAGNININANISSTSPSSLTLIANNDIILTNSIHIGGDLRLLAAKDIASSAAISITTNGGNVLLSSDVDSHSGGKIKFTGGLQIHTNGGAVTFAGGDMVGSGYASGHAGTQSRGMRFDNGLQILSNGGDIVFRGRSAPETPRNGIAAGIHFRSGDMLFDSGTGTITIDGISVEQTAEGRSNGILVHSGLTLRSSSTSSAAIKILADSSATQTGNGNSHAIAFISGALRPVTIIADGIGGGIEIVAIGNSVTPSMVLANSNFLASSGPISLLAQGNSAIVYLPGAGINFGSQLGTSIEQSNSNITIIADAHMLYSTQPVFTTSGTLSLLPDSQSFSESANWLPQLSTSWNQLGGLIIGKPGNLSPISFAAPTLVNGDIHLYGGDITLNHTLETVGSGRISINTAGRVTNAANGYLVADELSLMGGGSFSLLNPKNSVNVLAFEGNDLYFVNQSELTIGTAGPIDGINATGTVNVATHEGDLVVASDVITTNATEHAISLNAARNREAGDAAGGNLKLVGTPDIATGLGGRATLYTGSVLESDGVSELVGPGSGRFRYNSDESTSIFSLGMDSGLFAIYRQQPTLSIVASDASSVYGDTPI